jgi:hypothetical protein
MFSANGLCGGSAGAQSVTNETGAREVGNYRCYGPGGSSDTKEPVVEAHDECSRQLAMRARSRKSMPRVGTTQRKCLNTCCKRCSAKEGRFAPGVLRRG